MRINLEAAFILSAIAIFAVSARAEGDQSRIECPETQCKAEEIYELEVSEDGKGADVYNENGDIISHLTVADLIGLGEMPARLIPIDPDSMSASDKALVSLIETKLTNKERLEGAKDSLADFLVYTDKSGLKFYEFDQNRQTHDEATEICQTKGLRLMTKSEAESLKKELGADEPKAEKWLSGKEYIRVWTSSVHSASSNYAWIFDVGVSISLYDYRRGDDLSVRCVAR